MSGASAARLHGLRGEYTHTIEPALALAAETLNLERTASDLFNQAYAVTPAEIDKTLLIHDAALRDIFQKFRPLLQPPPAPPKPEIGLHVKEDAVPYRIRRKAAC